MNELLARLLFSVWAIEKQHADIQIPVLLNALKGNPITDNFELNRKKSIHVGFATSATPYDISDYAISSSPENAPKNSVAIVNFTDTIYKYDMNCGPVGMKTKANILRRIDANPNIIGTTLIIDTPGGEGSAARLINDTIKSLKKPVVAFVEDLSASAGYYIASAADYIYSNNSQALIGSIGTYITIADYAGYYEQMGLKVMEVYADKSKDKNQDYWQAVLYMNTVGKEGSLDGIKKLVNQFNDSFLADVKANRKNIISEKDSDWNTGRLMFAKEAQKVGLIDGIDTLENVISNFF